MLLLSFGKLEKVFQLIYNTYPLISAKEDPNAELFVPWPYEQKESMPFLIL